MPERNKRGRFEVGCKRSASRGFFIAPSARHTHLRVSRDTAWYLKSIKTSWNYGDYEGNRRPEILAVRPDWIIFRDGCPNGESPADVAARADRFISRIRTTPGNVAVFSSGHFLSVLIARWLGFDASAGRYFKLGTGALSVLGYDHDSASEPVLRLLNERPG